MYSNWHHSSSKYLVAVIIAFKDQTNYLQHSLMCVTGNYYISSVVDDVILTPQDLNIAHYHNVL
jgi:hypothetical protein